jgi:two-component system sensor histidine kinase NreB
MKESDGDLSESSLQLLKESLKSLTDIKFALDVSSIVAITDQQGKITYVNDKFCEISKYTKAELLGEDHRIINSGYHSKSFFRELYKTIHAGHIWQGEIRNRAKDGSYYWVDTTIVPFLDDEDRPYQFISIRNEITDRKRMEAAIKGLSKQIMHAQERERSLISREIHDDLGQVLAVSKMTIQSLLDERDLSAYIRERISQVLLYHETLIKKVRSLSSSLKPVVIEQLGLRTALRSLIQQFAEPDDFKIIFECSKEIDDLRFYDDPIHIYRIIQESLTNIAKHARANEVHVSLVVQNKLLVITIADDGIGFNVQDKKEQFHGIGLSSLQDRAEVLNGTSVIQSTLNLGTRIVVSIPVMNPRLKDV